MSLPNIVFHLLEPAAADRPWRFDPLSALIGAVTTLLLVLLAYALRRELRAGWKAVTEPLVGLYHGLIAGVEDRYCRSVFAHARSLTTPAHVAPLDTVFAEPRLGALLDSLPSGGEEETIPETRGTLPLSQVFGGHPQIVVVGDSGMGKTALLAHLALICSRNAVQTEDGQPAPPLASLRERLPFFVNLPILNWDQQQTEGETEEQLEKVEPQSDGVARLIEGAVATVGGGGGMGRALRQWLETGRAIVLVDGWDALPPDHRRPAAAWLDRVVADLPDNVWLVVAESRGYAPLVEAGFVPVKLIPWSLTQLEAFVQQWLDVYAAQDTAGEEEAKPISRLELLTELQPALRQGDTPLELVLRAFIYLADRQTPAGRAALFDRTLELLLRQEDPEDAWLPALGRAALGKLALQAQQEGRWIVAREEISAAVDGVLPPAEELPANAAARVLRTLVDRPGLLRPMGPRRYAFVHHAWRAYLAARQLVAADPAILAEHLDDPGWAGTLSFYAELGDMGPLVATWLRTPDDMFFTRLRTLAGWIGVAPEDVSWQDSATAVLARAFVKPGLPASIRRSLGQALAATKVSGVSYLFRQVLQSPDPDTRAAGVLGLAQMARESDLAILESMLEDESPIVRQAVVQGVARLPVSTATRWLRHILLEGDDALRPLAAQKLPQFGEQGRTILDEAVESQDLVARRAAVFGLAQLEARETLERVAREDEQWIVRSAALAALEHIEQAEDEEGGLAPPPDVSSLPWLISWAATIGEGVGVGEAAHHMLHRALVEGDAETRFLAMRLLSRIGRPQDAKALRAILTDADPRMVNAALDALSEIARRYDLPV